MSNKIHLWNVSPQEINGQHFKRKQVNKRSQNGKKRKWERTKERNEKRKEMNPQQHKKANSQSMIDGEKIGEKKQQKQRNRKNRTMVKIVNAIERKRRFYRKNVQNKTNNEQPKHRINKHTSECKQEAQKLHIGMPAEKKIQRK